MNCNIVKDLIPLYIDECCSEESAQTVRAHLASCPACAGVYARMTANAGLPEQAPKPANMGRISQWKASVLQSGLLFASFLLTVVGVALEAATPFGEKNGLWALALIVPATGLLLSLASWFFVRLFRSRKAFARCALAATLCLSACGYLWAILHYGPDAVKQQPGPLCAGLALTAVFCVLSRFLSDRYAVLLGKE